MADKIRTRKVQKSIKALDKAAVSAERMKRTYVRTKEGMEQTQEQEEENPAGYAENKMENAVDTAVRKTAHQVRKKGGEFVCAVKERHRASKETRQIKRRIKRRIGEEYPSASGEVPASSPAGRERASCQPEGYMKKQAETSQRRIVRTRKSPGQAVKISGYSEKTIKTAHKAGRTVKATGKGTVRTVGKTVKTSERSAKAAVKTTEQAAKAAQAAAKDSAKAAQKSAQASRAAAKATAAAVRVAINAVIAAAKAAISGIKALVSAIAAGGWVAVVVILLICMLGLLLGSAYGIFFSGESTESGGMDIQAATAEINTEYQEKVEEIKSKAGYDVLEMSSTGAAWKEVLAVYAVKVNTDSDNPQEVATMDENKKQLLKNIFWEMNTISSSTESVTETIKEESDDGHGNIVTAESTVTRTYLYITVSHKTADEMAEQYGFSGEQKAQLKELLSDEYAGLWNSVLYGISSGDGRIVEMAVSQIGNVGGEPYWSWYGFENRVEWCACFISWCSAQCGYIDTGIMPKFSLCTDGVAWFKDRGRWQDGSYMPGAGDIIFFDWDGDGESDHVGIVESVIEDRISTIEGNSGNEVRRNSYPVGSRKIYGYGIML